MAQQHSTCSATQQHSTRSASTLHTTQRAVLALQALNRSHPAMWCTISSQTHLSTTAFEQHSRLSNSTGAPACLSCSGVPTPLPGVCAGLNHTTHGWLPCCYTPLGTPVVFAAPSKCPHMSSHTASSLQSAPHTQTVQCNTVAARATRPTRVCAVQCVCNAARSHQ